MSPAHSTHHCPTHPSSNDSSAAELLYVSRYDYFCCISSANQNLEMQDASWEEMFAPYQRGCCQDEPVITASLWGQQQSLTVQDIGKLSRSQFALIWTVSSHCLSKLYSVSCVPWVLSFGPLLVFIWSCIPRKCSAMPNPANCRYGHSPLT